MKYSPTQLSFIKYTSGGLNDFKTQIELIEMFIDCFWELIDQHKYNKLKDQREHEAKLVFQMMFSRLLHLKKLLEGINYNNPNKEVFIKNLIDPTVINANVRNIYEMVCMFHVIYRMPNTDDEKKIIYNLWVIAGLKYRQRFSEITISQEANSKAEKEKVNIENLIQEIKDTQLFQNITEENQKQIKNAIRRKDFKVKIKNGEVKLMSWQEISDEFLTASDMFTKMYTYFSLYAHPSNVSVFQFKDMFKNEEDTNELVVFNIRFVLALSSIFLADMIKLFPVMLLTFEKRTLLNQALLDFYNSAFRGENFSINGAPQKI